MVAGITGRELPRARRARRCGGLGQGPVPLRGVTAGSAPLPSLPLVADFPSPGRSLGCRCLPQPCPQLLQELLLSSPPAPGPGVGL